MGDYKLNIDLQQAITGTKELTTSIENLNKSIDGLGDKITQMGTKSKSTSDRIKQGTKEQRQQMAALKREIREVEGNFVGSAKKRAKALDELKRKQDRLTAAMQKTGKVAQTGANNAAAAQANLNKQVSLGRQLFLRLKSVMLTIFGAYAIIQGIRNTINTVKDFELGIARLQAITGATADEMDRLSASARVLSQTGIFDATQITEVQVQLAKFGFTLQEIADSTEGIIKLATATGEELAPAATLLSSVIRGLGLDASETARVVDVLGKSFTSSALDLNKFRESAKFFVPLARQLGWSIEEVAAVLGKLADSGISGSLAGTGLRQTFIELWNSSSDLSNILGSGIKTFDEFVGALERVREEGVSVDKVLAAVPTRAKTMFSVLLSGASDIREFAGELNNASGAIDEMASVQMDTLAFQMERFNASWKAFILSVQQNGGWLTDFFRGLSIYLNEAAASIDPMGAGMRRAQRAVLDFRNELRETGRENNLDAIRDQIDKVTDDLNEAKEAFDELGERPSGGGVGGDAFVRRWEAAQALVESLKREVELLNDELFSANVRRSVQTNIDEILNRMTELSTTGVSDLDAFSKAYDETLTTIEGIRDAFPDGSEQREIYDAIIDGVKRFAEERRRLLIEDAELAKKLGREQLDEWIKNQQKLLDFEEKNMILRAKRMEDEQAMEEQLLGIQKFFTTKRLELLILSGTLTTEQEAAVRQQIIEIENTFQNELTNLRDGYIQEDLDERRKQAEEQIQLQQDAFDIRLQEMKNAGVSEQEIQRETLKFQIQVLKTQIEIAKAFGASAEEIEGYATQIDLAAAKLDGITDDETVDDVEKNTNKIANAYKRLASEIIDSLSTIADAQVENTERLVDDLNNRIAETQRALDQEIELYAAGYASNVTAKREELTQLQAARAEAEKDREAAIRRQQQLEAISQAASLFTAVANTVKIYSGIPGVGLGIAAAVVAGFLALFKQSQAQVKNITQFGSGGEIDGNSHARGGVMIEAEGGEFVVRKSAYAKYAPLVKAINDDDVPTINKHILSNTTFDRKGDKVVVDNKIWNKMYDLWEKNLGGENVQIVGTKKIVSRGIKKRIINV